MCVIPATGSDSWPSFAAKPGIGTKAHERDAGGSDIWPERGLRTGIGTMALDRDNNRGPFDRLGIRFCDVRLFRCFESMMAAGKSNYSSDS